MTSLMVSATSVGNTSDSFTAFRSDQGRKRNAASLEGQITSGGRHVVRVQHDAIMTSDMLSDGGSAPGQGWGDLFKNRDLFVELHNF